MLRIIEPVHLPRLLPDANAQSTLIYSIPWLGTAVVRYTAPVRRTPLYYLQLSSLLQWRVVQALQDKTDDNDDDETFSGQEKKKKERLK